MPSRERDELGPPIIEEWVGGNDEPIGSLPGEPCENRFWIVLTSGMERLELHADRPSGIVHPVGLEGDIVGF